VSDAAPAGDAPAGSPPGAVAPDEVRRGRPPTDEEARWTAAGRELTPLKTLERIDAKAAFVLGNVTVVGAILAGLGVVGGTTGQLMGHRGGLLTTLALLLLAVLCALGANLPSLATVLNPNDVNAVRGFLTRNIRVRGWLTRIALVCLTAAILVAAGLVLQVAGTRPEPSLALQWTRAGDTQRGVAARMTVSSLPPGTRAQTRLVAPGGDRGADDVLAEDVSLAGGSGQLTVTMEVDDVPSGVRLRLSTVLTAAGDRISDGEVELAP
jgi:hypothetical protein